MNFKNQGVIIEEALLGGKIDKIVFTDNKELSVHDFKTGKIAESWDGKDVYEKIKLHNYRRQLVFYKILVENSREFSGNYTVNTGVLDFVEPYKDKIYDLPLIIEPAEVERTLKLIHAVYKKIQHLDFPDVEFYSKDIHGIKQFEDDLITGKV